MLEGRSASEFDNIISTNVININELIKMLEEERKIAIDWFKTNETIVNPDEFQALIIRRNNPGEDLYKLNISGKDIILESNLKLLGIDIKLKDKLSFY